MYVIDQGEDQMGQLETLMNELELYLPGLSRRPSVLVRTKFDKEFVDVEHFEGEPCLKDLPECFLGSFNVSSKNGWGLRTLVSDLRVILESDPKPPHVEIVEEEDQTFMNLSSDERRVMYDEEVRLLKTQRNSYDKFRKKMVVIEKKYGFSFGNKGDFPKDQGGDEAPQ